MDYIARSRSSEAGRHPIGLVEPTILAQRDPSTEAVEPVSLAMSAYKLYKEFKLWQNESARRDAIEGINRNIKILFEEIARIHRRIEAVRDELINLIDEIEYRNLVGEVRGLSESVGSLASGTNTDYLDAAHIIAHQAYIRILPRLDDNANEKEHAYRYIRYLDLLILLVACRVTIIAGAPSLTVDIKNSFLTDQTTNVLDAVEHAKGRLIDVTIDSYEPCRIPSDDHVIPPQEGDYAGSYGVAFGYRKKGTSDCRFAFFVSRSGTSLSPEAEHSAWVEASRKFPRMIEKMARAEANSLWEQKYGVIVDNSAE